jgi:hypothetical protein
MRRRAVCQGGRTLTRRPCVVSLFSVFPAPCHATVALLLLIYHAFTRSPAPPPSRASLACSCPLVLVALPKRLFLAAPAHTPGNPRRPTLFSEIALSGGLRSLEHKTEPPSTAERGARRQPAPARAPSWISFAEPLLESVRALRVPEGGCAVGRASVEHSWGGQERGRMATGRVPEREDRAAQRGTPWRAASERQRQARAARDGGATLSRGGHTLGALAQE